MDAKKNDLKDMANSGGRRGRREKEGMRETECTYARVNNVISIFDKSGVSQSDCSCGYMYLFDKYVKNI